jgi:hypothetical protein
MLLHYIQASFITTYAGDVPMRKLLKILSIKQKAQSADCT